MINFTFRPAKVSEVKPLIGLYSESGCGKTYSSLLLAKGFAGNMGDVGMIETEAGRGEVFADDDLVGGYQVLSIRDEFSPKTYGQAIDVANKSGLKVLIVDSASHEWEGAGGVLSMAAKNQEDGKKGPLVWQMPKLLHQREFVLKILGTPIPLVIVCMRAKYPMKEVKKHGIKEWIRAEVVEPKQSDDMLFEMMVHAWIDKDHNAHVTKYTKDVFRSIFVNGEPITVETGKRLAAWVVSATVQKPHTEPLLPKEESPTTDATGSETGKKPRPLLKSQATEIFKVAAALETPLNKTEATEVIDWYCASNNHGGRTYEAGQALIFGFETIFNRYLDEVKFAGGQNNEDDR